MNRSARDTFSRAGASRKNNVPVRSFVQSREMILRGQHPSEITVLTVSLRIIDYKRFECRLKIERFGILRQNAVRSLRQSSDVLWVSGVDVLTLKRVEHQ